MNLQHEATLGDGNRIWWLKRISIFEDQTDSLYQSIETQMAPMLFTRGQPLPLAAAGGTPKHIYLIVTGQVKLSTTTEAGKEIILDILGPEDVFGPIEEVVFRGRQEFRTQETPTDAIAMSDGEAYRLTVDYFQDLVRRRPTVMVSLARFLGLRQRYLEIRLTRLLYRSSLGKLAGLLCELAERYGEIQGSHIALTMRLTHQDLASIIGTKRDTVSRGLAELELQELIRYERNKIVLLNPKKLDEIL
jgi:CRP/FNR family transcriptional regulator